MRVQDLKNYGRSHPEVMPTIPPDLMKKMKDVSMKTLRGHLGLLGVARFLLVLWREQRRLMKRDYNVAREHGLTDETFLHSRIQNTAIFTAIAKIAGEEKALTIMMEITEAVAYDLMSSMFPTIEDLRACGDPFVAFKEYARAGNAANEKAGVHRVEYVEDTPDTFQFNITYCAYHSIPDEVGLGAACLSSCYADDLFFPRLCHQIGVRFIRTGTIARGDAVCDFRFKKGGETTEGLPPETLKEYKTK